MKKIHLFFLLIFINTLYCCEDLLHIAVSRKDWKNTKKYLECGFNVNTVCKNKTILQIAIENNDITMIKLILGYHPHDKCFLAAFSQDDQRIIQCYFTHPDVTPTDRKHGYNIAQIVEDYSIKQSPYATTARLFIQYCDTLKEREVYTIRTSGGTISTILRDCHSRWSPW